MKYMKIFSLFPLLTSATLSNAARPSFDIDQFEPGQGYLDDSFESLESDFSYVDGDDNTLTDFSPVHSVARRQAAPQYESSMGNNGYSAGQTLADLGTTLGTSYTAATAGGDSEHSADSSSSSTEYPADKKLTVEEGAQVLTSLQAQVVVEAKKISDSSEPEATKTINAHHFQVAADLLAAEYNVTKEVLEEKLRKANVALQAAVAVADSKTNSEESLFRNSGKNAKCRKGQQVNQFGQCEAVLPLNLNYGCWCHADNSDIFKGKGQHVDEFDKACKMYKQCLRCVRHDARNNGEVCDPGTVRYSTENHRSKDGIHMECSRNNADAGNCAINTCCCEVEYVRTILRLFVFEGVKLNNKHYHNKFDHEEKCQGKEGNGHANDCCGNYPHRRMYNTHGKSCCNNTSVFDPYTHVCCDDGSSADSIENCGSPVRKRKRRSTDNERRRKLFMRS